MPIKRQNHRAGAALALVLCANAFFGMPSWAEDDSSTASDTAQSADQDADAPADKQQSPWLFTPLISANPKFGTSIGALGAYLKKFDDQSPVSMFGINGTYSDTASWFVGFFAQTFFAEDRQRLTLFLGRGKIENDFEDFLGTGANAQTTDNININYLRYLYRVKGDWFIGAHGVATNYTSAGADPTTDDVLDQLGLAGFQSNGLGLYVLYDSRDNTRSASSGSQFKLNNIAYREGLGGDTSFDIYQLEYDAYRQWIKKQVTAIQIKGRWAVDAPNSAYSSIELKGYTRGELLAENMMHAIADQRILFYPRWGMTVTAGLACLYGDDAFGEDQSCGDRDNLFPSLATGGIFVLKPKEKMVVRAELAAAKNGRYAFYLSFGQPF